MLKLSEIIVAPHETEKAHKIDQNGVYIFRVANSANKTLIKKAFQKYYGVEVLNVQIIKIQPKKRGLKNRVVQKRSLGKKAIIRTAGGKVIEVNQIKV